MHNLYRLNLGYLKTTKCLAGVKVENPKGLLLLQLMEVTILKQHLTVSNFLELAVYLTPRFDLLYFVGRIYNVCLNVGSELLCKTTSYHVFDFKMTSANSVWVLK